ncbi:hypothetical protein LUCX_226 [Xanthomonas phage vB_XciM_LucasX]|nr:hypothetical protein LUCX_226 [Xanthomonas phage vB_XciM_LucasX]
MDITINDRPSIRQALGAWMALAEGDPILNAPLQRNAIIHCLFSPNIQGMASGLEQIPEDRRAQAKEWSQRSLRGHFVHQHKRTKRRNHRTGVVRTYLIDSVQLTGVAPASIDLIREITELPEGTLTFDHRFSQTPKPTDIT